MQNQVDFYGHQDYYQDSIEFDELDQLEENSQKFADPFGQTEENIDQVPEDQEVDEFISESSQQE